MIYVEDFPVTLSKGQVKSCAKTPYTLYMHIAHPHLWALYGLVFVYYVYASSCNWWWAFRCYYHFNSTQPHLKILFNFFISRIHSRNFIGTIQMRCVPTYKNSCFVTWRWRYNFISFIQTLSKIDLAGWAKAEYIWLKVRIPLGF